MDVQTCTRRDWLRIAGAGAASLALPDSLLAGPGGNGEPPNIVLILADDLGYGDPRCYNAESKIPTPNIDRLAGEGVRFTDAHSPSAVCTPTRYGILTGQYCWRTRLKQGVLWTGYAPALIEPDRTTVAALLQTRGYHTGCVGKWHLGFNWASKTGAPVSAQDHDHVDFSKPVTRGPNAVGFDYSCIIPASLDMPPYCWIENGRCVEPPTVMDPGSKRVWAGGGGFWREGLRSPSFRFNEVLPTIADRACSYVDRRGADGKPFFLYVPFASPHTPWVPNEAHRGKSGAGAYGDFVHETDWAVGRLLSTLERQGLRNNTLVILTSDNGAHWPASQIERHGHRANGACRGQKADIWEGGHRVPFIARWPGHVQPESRCDETICQTDLIATCAGVAGVRLPGDAGEDSYDIMPYMLGRKPARPIREATVHHSLNGMFAIRQGKWKLILGRGSGGFTKPKKVKPSEGEPTGQLYDLVEDLGETRNVWQDQPDVVRRLTTLLERYQRTGRSAPQSG